MSWRRRRANSSLVIAPGPLSAAAPRTAPPGDGPPPAPRTRAALHPHELDQLRVGALVGLQILAGIDPGARDFGEVAHDLAGLARQPGGVRDAAGAQSVEKT